MSINEAIQELYEIGFCPEIACDIDGETGELGYRIDKMINQLEEVTE